MHRAIAALGLCAATGALGGVPVRPATTAASVVAWPADAPAVERGPGDTKVNQFVSYNATGKTVTIALFAALNSAQGGFNFNGGSSGNQTITVPLGWKVHFDVHNDDAIPHSAILITDQTPIPNGPSQAAFPRAYTDHLADGLPAQTGNDTMDFTATPAGNYLIACGVPGHAPSGMYIKFVVSATATVPANTGTIATGK
jgi:sulfocyanin